MEEESEKKRSELDLLIHHTKWPAMLFLAYTEVYKDDSGFFFWVLVWTTLVHIHNDEQRCKESGFTSAFYKVLSNILWFLLAEWVLLQITTYSWRAIHKLERAHPDSLIVLDIISKYMIKSSISYLRMISSVARYRVVNLIIQILY
ncbi:unnamed protein product [Orchesella dallaii]|uniref:Uncharacterized protein n=1 Tax=Orchesella dallaii TaxID=48710 RepID=A0ABP1Q728_9HEXA